METTKSIFAISPSGYIENENSGSGQTNVVEIIKSGIDKIGKSELRSKLYQMQQAIQKQLNFVIINL